MSLMEAFDRFLAGVALWTKQPLWSFNRIETSVDEHTLITDDGSLITLVQVAGARTIMGPEELHDIERMASLALAGFLNGPGHVLDAWFVRDPTAAGAEVQRHVRGMRGTAKALRLDLADLFDEQERVLADHVASEGLYLALWSRPSLLTADDRKASTTRGQQQAATWPKAAYAQYPLRDFEGIVTQHQSFVAKVISTLKDCGIRAKQVEVHEALRVVRASIYPDMASNDWRPCLPGDRVPQRWPEEAGDLSHQAWPMLNEQLFDRDAMRLDTRAVRIGDTIFVGLDMTLGPLEPKPFAALLAAVSQLDRGMPWRIRFLTEGAGMAAAASKKFAATWLAVSAHNKKIKAAFDALAQDLAQDRTAAAVRLRVSLATWGPADDLQLVRARAAKLARAFEGWGYCHTAMTAGDPLACVMGSTLGLDVASTAPPAVAPIEDVVAMLPLGRSASPWLTGSMLLRSIDGRLWPYQTGSSLATFWFTLIAGGPGSGKSVLAASLHLGDCLASDVAGLCGGRLPPIGIIDVGPSSSGLISLLQTALPPERRHEAVYERLTLTAAKSVNPLDTQLGARYPLPKERSFLVNLLTLLMAEPGEHHAPRGSHQLINAVLSTVYQRFADDADNPKSRPKPYVAGEEPLVDDAIMAHAVARDDHTTWWEVVDGLFDAGAIREAGLAQRRAVPRLEDFLEAVRDPSITDLFRDSDGEALIIAFTRGITAALGEFPNLTDVTRFEVSDARVVSLDLEEVVGGESAADVRRSGVMYLLARFIVGRNFYLHEDEVAAFPPRYRRFQEARIKGIREMPKGLFYDEFHKTSSAGKLIRPQVVDDGRVGRKYGVKVRLASQLYTDFDAEMTELATEIFVLKSAGKEGNRRIADGCGLNATAVLAIERYLHGPGPGGAPFLGVFRLKDGEHQHVLVNTLGPTAMWAFATGKEDRRLRDGLYRLCGPMEARRRLATRFPEGSAVDDVQRRLRDLQDSEALGLSDHEAEGSVIEDLVRELGR